MGSKLKFAHLHQHTQFSLLDGAAKLQDLLKWVKETTPEDPALAMTDHGNLFGAVEFYKKATAMGVKPIIGYEAYVAAESRFDRKRGKGLDGGYFHLTLLAKDFTGYQNLVRLASRAYLEGFYEKPRIDREILREHAQGLIALSGCLGAEIPQFILQDRLDLAEARLNEDLSIFGDRFFIEIQNHGLPEQKKVNQVLKEFARKYGLGMVATNDGHYVRKEDARAHEVLLAIQSKTTLDDPERWRFPCDEFYVKTPEEMRAMLPEAEWGDEPFDNTVEIARMCDVDLPIGDKMVYRIPRFPLPEGRTEAQYLRELTFLGLLRRYPDRITEAFYREVLRLLGTMPPHGDERALAEALARVEEKAWEELRKRLPPLEGVREWTAEAILHRALYELSVIERMGFPGYFLIVQDYINWARGHGVSVGPGRGSAAGSLVAYAVGITNIDPLRFGLLFERFLNPERVSMPDIDTDFSDRERDRVIQYVRERYGEDKVAQIGTFGSLASKAALKDVARVYGIPHKKAEELAKLIPVQFGKPKPLQEAIQVVPELRAEMEKDERIRQVIEVAMRLEGLNRHASVHAAGVVIAAEPLTDLVPLMRDQEGRPVTQYDMGAVEALGLLKMDFLGLRTLTFLDEARRIVKESKGVELDYDRLPLDDPKTFELLSRGETKGVFQLESGGMTATVRGLKPRRLEDIIALVSLYRPGPMEHIPTYIRRHHGQEPVSYAEFPHAEKYLRPILDETYGIPVYQEQIMQIASQVAGYSLGEADLLRRAMGKKRVEEMQKHRERFVRGAKERGVPEEEANRLFDMLEAFANYGFNKSHAAAYSLLSYQTAYVKAHYPVEFMAALLSVERHDSDKVAEYIRDARALGIPVLPPDVNRSGFDFKVVGEEILFGLSAVKNVGEMAARAILEERERGGPFKSLGDFLKRLPEQVVNKRALESLVKAGALDAFGDRARLLASLEPLLRWAAETRERGRSGLVGLFAEVEEPPLVEASPLDEITMLRYEKEALGIYVSGHPVLRYPGLREVASCTIEELSEFVRELPGKPKVLLSGMVEEVVRKPTRSGGMMARFTLSDETGALEVVVFGRAYEGVSPKLKEDIPLLVLAEVEKGEELRVLAQAVWTLEEVLEAPKALEVEVDHALLDEKGVARLKSLLDEHPGSLPVYLRVLGPFGEALFALREVRVGEEALGLLEAEGYRAYLVPDREVFLQGNGGGPKEEVVPF
uniref:DNA polymerase III subunit alpha n=1 Tax=Thermus aquaticus TaxID=271 RepID=DPO3A_THEAQ|nr:RecName: Full=DNA polymerase III subunit alpha [Thermus aquaticus]2HPI_A Chain A, DNA polymerase III alpha subunit [Thermus aquaticus]2HPM_A Chain A, DNA Polymerase III alpha subunit [Thermus aquaticus]4IQJ_A Chain A, DNA polymerase III subunit alpha [Thermus aquaticus]4IQJ_B Chain B, DNA polymerase III subunit alpha [Thermus aquaticus]4IQJ_C Chain C, DNA polymerase III subunit alpha [Thermus aquaticus]4IQJ_D Chain D, DNA polymerase III subunit alpha [Thermus aquaticus]AAD44403.1 DNA poly